jgi:hypothetical protein
MILFKVLAKKFVKHGTSHAEFPQISCTVLYEIIKIRLGCHKFYARLVPKMLIGSHKMQGMASALTFLE